MTNEKILAQFDRAEKSADRHAAYDIALCIENDGDIYRQDITYVIGNLRKWIYRILNFFCLKVDFAMFTSFLLKRVRMFTMEILTISRQIFYLWK